MDGTQLQPKETKAHFLGFIESLAVVLRFS